MTIRLSRLNVNGYEVQDNFELATMEGQDFLVVTRSKNHDFFKRLVDQKTEITRFVKIDDFGVEKNLLELLYDYQVIRFTKYEEIDEFTLMIDIEKSDFKPTRNFGS